MKRTYSELKQIPTYEGRFEYLKLNGQVGSDTFGFDRYLNQSFYHSKEWLNFRNKIIIRDNGCDLGIEGHAMTDHIIIHHMNPITAEDLVHFNPEILDPEYVICVSDLTHKAIHYGDVSLLPTDPIERRPGDTCPWK